MKYAVLETNHSFSISIWKRLAYSMNFFFPQIPPSMCNFWTSWGPAPLIEEIGYFGIYWVRPFSGEFGGNVVIEFLEFFNNLIRSFDQTLHVCSSFVSYWCILISGRVRELVRRDWNSRWWAMIQIVSWRILRVGDMALTMFGFEVLFLLCAWIDLTSNQYHRSNWPGWWYQVGGFSFNRTFLNYRTTFQLPSLVKHKSVSQSQYTVIFISINISI